MAQAAAQMTIGAPRRVTPGALAIITAYGLALMVPILASILFVSTLSLGPATLVVPLAVVGAVLFFLPFGFGNLPVARLVRSLHPQGLEPRAGFIVQLTLKPRLRLGWRAVVEDADDFGWLEITASGLEFYGDSIRLSLPFEDIRQLRAVTMGCRGFFVPRAAVVAAGLPNVAELQFAERSCWLLLTSRAKARELYRRLSAAIVRK